MSNGVKNECVAADTSRMLKERVPHRGIVEKTPRGHLKDWLDPAHHWHKGVKIFMRWKTLL